MVTQWLAGQDITVDRLNDNHPRTISYTAITANTAGATAETVCITSGSFTIRNGRAFRCTFKGLYQSTAVNDQAEIRIRRTNTSGTTILDTQRTICSPTATTNVLGYWQNIFTNTTGSDITDVLVATYGRSAGGTGTILIAATAGQPAYIEVEDIGVAADFASATAIT